MNALQPEKEKGEEDLQDGITIHREVLNKEDLDCTVDVVRIHKF